MPKAQLLKTILDFCRKPFKSRCVNFPYRYELAGEVRVASAAKQQLKPSPITARKFVLCVSIFMRFYSCGSWWVE
jgi:hypothetical protein